MEFFNNTSNESLKFKLNSEGININRIEPRLILTTSENKNYFFVGKVRNDVCEFDIPELSLYEKNDNGKIKFEIISDDLYFPVWNDEFKIVSKASIKIEEMFTTENKQSSKPKITTNPMFEKKPSKNYLDDDDDDDEDDVNILPNIDKERKEREIIIERKKEDIKKQKYGFKKFTDF